MRKIGVLITCAIVAAWQLLPAGFESAKETPAFVKPDTAAFEKDILPEILALNDPSGHQPSQTFRKGHVEKTELTDYFMETGYGYRIKMPTPSLIPTPAVVNGKLLVSGGFGSKTYYSFEAKTGKLDWAVALDDDGPSSPAVEDGIVVFNTESCTIFACDLVTGEQIWSYWLGDPLMSMPTIANGIVFTAYPAPYPPNEKRTAAAEIVPSHVLIAIELRTGKILWQKWIDSDIMSAPVAKEDLLYLTTFSGVVYKFRQRTGEILEAKAMRATSAPVFSENNDLIVSRRSDTQTDTVLSESIIVGSGAKQKLAYQKKADYLDKKVQSTARLKSQSLSMDAMNGFASGAPTNSNWMAAYENIGQSNVSSLQSFQGSRGLYNNGQLYTTMGDEIICTDTDGKLKWKYKLDGDLKSEGGFMGTPPIYANGHVIVATFTGDIIVIDEKKGGLSKKFSVHEPIRYQPIADDGWIYVTSINGTLHAINTGNSKISGWSMWGGNAARTNVPE